MDPVQRFEALPPGQVSQSSGLLSGRYLSRLADTSPIGVSEVQAAAGAGALLFSNSNEAVCLDLALFFVVG